jgi:hypothetical protein
MFWRTALPSLLLVASAGCAGTATRGLPDNHPASDMAESTPLPPRSTTLVVGPVATPTAAPAPGARPSAPHDHAAGQAMPSSDQTLNSAAAGTAVAAGAAYVCPMHPEVVSAKADDRCSKCNMKLRAKPGAVTPASTRSATQPAGGHQHDHGGH